MSLQFLMHSYDLMPRAESELKQLSSLMTWAGQAEPAMACNAVGDSCDLYTPCTLYSLLCFRCSGCLSEPNPQPGSERKNKPRLVQQPYSRAREPSDTQGVFTGAAETEGNGQFPQLPHSILQGPATTGP